jgi:hypothetical protein
MRIVQSEWRNSDFFLPDRYNAKTVIFRTDLYVIKDYILAEFSVTPPAYTLL